MGRFVFKLPDVGEGASGAELGLLARSRLMGRFVFKLPDVGEGASGAELGLLARGAV